MVTEQEACSQVLIFNKDNGGQPSDLYRNNVTSNHLRKTDPPILARIPDSLLQYKTDHYVMR